MITIGYTELLLTILVVCAVAATISLASLLRSAREAVDELRISLRAVQGLAGRLEAVLQDVNALTAETAKVGVPLVQNLDGLAGPLKQVRALAAGAEAGLAVLAQRAAAAAVAPEPKNKEEHP